MLDELVVAMLDKGLFGFLSMCASKVEVFVTPCGVFCKVFIISATSDAYLYGVFAGSVLITPSLRFSVCIILSTTPMVLWSSAGAKSNLKLFAKKLEFFRSKRLCLVTS